jgi:hypothetical protein
MVMRCEFRIEKVKYWFRKKTRVAVGRLEFYVAKKAHDRIIKKLGVDCHLAQPKTIQECWLRAAYVVVRCKMWYGISGQTKAIGYTRKYTGAKP